MTNDISRRNFLKLAVQGLVGISGLLALGGLMRFLSYKPAPPPPKRFEIGPEANYPGTRLKYRNPGRTDPRPGRIHA
jgi:hypothetical protein